MRRNLKLFLCCVALSCFFSCGQDDTTPPDSGSTFQCTDTTYGDSQCGYAAISFAGPLQSMALQPNGQLLVAGTENNGGTITYSLIRLNTDGTLDTTFGASANGKVQTNLVIGKAFAVDPISSSIYVAGATSGTCGTTLTCWAVERYTTAGVLDTNFGGSNTGIVTMDQVLSGSVTGFSISAIAIQPADSKIVIAGNITLTASLPAIGLARLLTTGLVDSSFTQVNQAFSTATPVTETADVSNVLIQSNEQILVVGTSCVSPAFNPICPVVMARFSTSGSLETSFGSSGEVVTSGKSVGTVALEPSDQKILTGLSYGGYKSIVRFNTDGSLDTTYASASSNEADSSASKFTFQADGAIIALLNGDNDFSLQRYDTSGSFDSTFSESFPSPFTGDLVGPSALVTQTDGSVIIGGTTGTLTNSSPLSVPVTQLLLIRFDPNSN